MQLFCGNNNKVNSNDSNNTFGLTEFWNVDLFIPNKCSTSNLQNISEKSHHLRQRTDNFRDNM